MKYKMHKKSFIFIFFLYTISAHNSSLFGYEETKILRNFETDEFDDLLNSLTTENLETLRSSCETGEAAMWINVFENLCVPSIPTILNDNFYLSTAVPVERNIINYPDFMQIGYQPIKNNGQFTCHFFYNQFTKKNYTENSQKLGCYVNINNPTFLSALDHALNSGNLPAGLAPLAGVDFPRVFQTLAGAKLEERRMGAFMHYTQKINDKYKFEIRLPILWVIKNLNFTEVEKEIIRREFMAFQSGGNFDEIAFAQKHLITDALGFGTLDFTMIRKIFDMADWGIDIGLSIYAPTDIPWATGLYGTCFRPVDEQPIFSFCDLVENIINNPIATPGAQDQLMCYFLKALDRLASMLLQCPLGYDQHTGIALKLFPSWQINDRLLMQGTYIFEYLLPYNEPRFFIKKLSKTSFSQMLSEITGPDANAIAEAQLLAIEERLTETLFPRVFTTNVSPGFIFNSYSNIQISYKKYDFTLGYNAWWKMGEKLSCVQAPHESIAEYDVKKATYPSASQIKLYGKIHRNFETTRNHNLVSVTLFGDLTVWNTAVGNDFLFGISIDKQF